MTYGEKLKDPRWQKKRLEIFERDKWMCWRCGDKQSTLHVHHLAYPPNREPWEVPNGFLLTLCEECHKNADYLTNQIGALLEAATEFNEGLFKKLISHCKEQKHIRKTR